MCKRLAASAKTCRPNSRAGLKFHQNGRSFRAAMSAIRSSMFNAFVTSTSETIQSATNLAVPRDIVKVSIRCRDVLAVSWWCLTALEQVNRHVT